MDRSQHTLHPRYRVHPCQHSRAGRQRRRPRCTAGSHHVRSGTARLGSRRHHRRRVRCLRQVLERLASSGHWQSSTPATLTSCSSPSLTAQPVHARRGHCHGACQKRGWSLVSCDAGGIDMSTPTGEAFAGNMLVFAQLEAASSGSEPKTRWRPRRRPVSVWAVLRHSLTPLSSASLLSARRAAHCLPLPQAWRRTASALPAAAHAGTRAPSRLSWCHNGPQSYAHSLTRAVAA